MRRHPVLLALPLTLVTALATLAFAAPALANDEDKAACADKQEGDDCTRSDGEAGVCVPDDSDPVLTCEDALGSSSSSDDDSSDDALDCSVTDDPGAAGLAALLGLGALLRLRRRH